MNFFAGEIQKAGSGYCFRRDEMELQLPEAWREALSPHLGLSVTLGIRPEDIGSALAENTPGMPRLKAVVDVTEPMGSETYVYANSGGKSFVSRVEPDFAVQPGSSTSLPIYLPRAHVFDARGAVVV